MQKIAHLMLRLPDEMQETFYNMNGCSREIFNGWCEARKYKFKEIVQILESVFVKGVLHLPNESEIKN